LISVRINNIAFIIFAGSLGLLLPFLSVGQEKTNEFRLKISAGLNGCQIHGDNYAGYDKLGMFAGIAVNARLKKKSSLELGFYFSQKGARHNPNYKTGDYSYYRVHLNYLDMPLSFRYQLNADYFITLGPSLAYLISYTEENEIGDWTGVYPFEKFEVGVNAGLGRRFNDSWSVELRTSNSITPIRSYGVLANRVFYPNPVAQFFNKGMYNNILTLMVTYHLKPRKKSE
jgi:hypothetical protein